jgi:hypothetical protein
MVGLFLFLGALENLESFKYLGKTVTKIAFLENEEQIRFGDYLLPFCSEHFAFPSFF